MLQFIRRPISAGIVPRMENVICPNTDLGGRRVDLHIFEAP